MSTFERDEFKWRETYFVLFDAGKRPTLKKVEQLLLELSPRFNLSNAQADDQGLFESITIMSPDDYAALDISFESGEEVSEQGQILREELKSSAADALERKRIDRLPKCDARFDLLHFEQVSDDPAGEDDDDEVLDPSALLIVLDALVELVDGVGVDPQSGTLL